MNNKKILIVDDDRLVLAAFERGLRNSGYEVSTAESGPQALQVCAETPPDLVLLDIRMPEMSGLEVAQRLRRETDVPFVFLSAYDDIEILKQAAEHGALGYLVKPVGMPQVIAVVEAALARAEDLRQLRKSEADLGTALAGNREVSAAVGILMERHRLSEKEAFEALRVRARSERRKLNEIAGQILHAEETLNWPVSSAKP
ncbi:MAG TPA: response regulator [Acidiferrobacterales bacterium]|nr:response regulator [Acidiferrobacterales bacterium]